MPPLPKDPQHRQDMATAPLGKALRIEERYHHPDNVITLRVRRHDNPAVAVTVTLAHGEGHAPGEWAVDNITPHREGAATGSYGEMQGKFGPGHMRELVRHVQATYGIKKLVGMRVTGARAKAEKDDISTAKVLAKSQATPRALTVYPHVRPFTPEELENEVGEYFHNPETQKALPKAFASPAILRSKIQEAPLRVLSHAQLSSLPNSDAGDILSHANPMHRVRELGREYGRDPKRILDGMQQQAKLPTPIVIHHDHGMHLLGGNTRLMTMAAVHQTMPVRMIDIRSEGASPDLAKGFERNDDYRPPRSLRLVSKPVKTDTALGGRLEITAHSYDIFDSLAEHAEHPIGQVSVRKQTRVSDGQVSHTARINGDNQRDHGLGVQGLKSVATMIAKMHPELREFAISRRKASIRQAVNATERVPYLPGMTSAMRAERAAGNSKAVLQTAREAEEAVVARGISPYQQKTHPNPFADLAKSIKLGREDRSTQVADGWHHGGSDESPMNPHKRLVRAGEAVGTYKLTEHAARLNHFYVDEVQAVTRGGGRAAMQHIIDHADRHGVSLNLMANPLRPQGEGKKMTTAKLRSWYRGFGFRPKQGDLMVRTPVRSLDRPMDGGA